MSDVAVSFSGIGKRYRVAHVRQSYGRLSESMTGAVRGALSRLRGGSPETVELFWALRDVTFDVKRGEVMGIVGRNGAGKTTLLKILSRITEPTTGRVALRGSVSSLLEVGTGFHPELTGRENVYLSGAILGMRRSDIQRRFDEIVEFADIEQFLDTPVKRYSSGMLVRLGFAVAAHLEPDILVVDEVLAVGDAAFQRKCISKMEDVSHEGRTVLFVSHNMPAVESLCTKAVLLDSGAVESIGSVSDVVTRYMQAAAVRRAMSIADRTDRDGSGRMRIVGIESSLRTGDESWIRLRYEADRELTNVDFGMGVFGSRGEGAASLTTFTTGTMFPRLPKTGTVVCTIPKTPLVPGRYSINVHCKVNSILADWVRDAADLEVVEGDFFGTGRMPPQHHGFVLIEHGWSADES